MASPFDLDRLADFLFEAGMLKDTPRTGYQFLGSGRENVAEHSFRAAIIGYVLANMAGANSEKTALLCLFHDFHEARTGDLNYVNHQYNSANAEMAMHDALCGSGLEKAVMPLWEEQEKAVTLEAELSKDADQIDLILNLKKEADLGNPYALKWLDAAVKRLRTKPGKDLAAKIAETDHTRWWYGAKDNRWWIHRKDPETND